MRIKVFAGLILGLMMIVIAFIWAADNPSMFFSLPGLFLVIGGTLLALFISYPYSEVKKLPAAFLRILQDEESGIDEEVETVNEIAWLMTRHRIPPIQNRIDDCTNPYLRNGLQMVLDSIPIDQVSEMLTWRMIKLKQSEQATAQMFKSMAVFAPAFGMVGTLFGLINMLDGLDANGLVQMGGNMALALMTTLYGIVLANLIFKPMAIKLERRTEQRLMHMNLLREGILMLAKGKTPSSIRETLKSYLLNLDDEMFDETSFLIEEHQNDRNNFRV